MEPSVSTDKEDVGQFGKKQQFRKRRVPIRETWEA
jgi:hypothetical protein